MSPCKILQKHFSFMCFFGPRLSSACWRVLRSPPPSLSVEGGRRRAWHSFEISMGRDAPFQTAVYNKPEMCVVLFQAGRQVWSQI